MEAFADELGLFEKYPIPAPPPAQASDLLGAFFGAAPDRMGAQAKGLEAGSAYRLRSAQGEKALEEAGVEREKRLQAGHANALRAKVAANPNYIPTPSETMLIATGANDFSSALGGYQERGFRDTLADPNATPQAQFAAGQGVQGKVMPQVQALGAGREINMMTQDPYTNPVGGAQMQADTALASLRNRTDPNIRATGAGGVGGAGGARLPIGAMKIVDDATTSLGAAAESESLAAEAINTLATSGVNLGMADNLLNRGRNYIGASTPDSQAYATVQQTFEKLRNNYLLLAKGVQTENDAMRAWNAEIGEAAAYDNDLATQQLNRALAIIDMTRQLQNRRIEGVYTNYGQQVPQMYNPNAEIYGAGPAGPAGPAAPAPAAGGLTPEEQAELAALRAEFNGSR